jgi:flagellar protein FliJ
MAKFQFQLASVEKVRNQKEQKMLEELAVAQRNYLEKINEKKTLLGKKQDSFIQKNELVSKDASINEIRLIEEYIVGLKANIIRADQAIIRSRRFLEQAMRHYLVARKEKMMVDKLKESALEAFKLEQSRLEQKQLDDLMTMRARLNHGPIQNEEEIA